MDKIIVCFSLLTQNKLTRVSCNNPNLNKKYPFHPFPLKKYYCGTPKVICNFFHVYLIVMMMISILLLLPRPQFNIAAVTIMLMKVIDENSMTQQCWSTSLRFCLPCAQLDRCCSPTSDLENKN